MNTIEELILKECPEGVEYLPLIALCEDVIVPMRDKPKVFDGDTPWCRIEDLEGFYFNDSLSGQYVSQETIRKMNLKVFPIGTVICSCSASIGTYAINTKPLITNQTFIGLVCGEKLLNTFLRYYMETQTKNLLSLSNTGTIPYISRKKFENLEIPVPPLSVQHKIVEILDKFTSLEAELQTKLQAELEARKKQYEYYRNQLLDFTGREDVEFKKLGEVISVARGASPRPIKNYITTNKDGINWIKIGDVKPNEKYITNTEEKITQEGASKSRLLKKGSFILSNSMSFGRPYILAIDGCIHDGWISMTNYEKFYNVHFLYHLLKSDSIQMYWRMKASSGTVSNLNADIVRATPIPIPSLTEQQRIVTILDKFEALINDQTASLAAEIKARHQQYEYYRDRLLTFSRKEN